MNFTFKDTPRLAAGRFISPKILAEEQLKFGGFEIKLTVENVNGYRNSYETISTFVGIYPFKS